MKRMSKIFAVLALVLIISIPEIVKADVTFTGASGNLAASTTFSISGDYLTVLLANPSTHDALVPTDVLTAVFWSVSPSITLIPVSAVLTAGSTVLFGNTDPGGAVGGEWAYKAGLSGAPGNAAQGIGSAGFGLFGPPDLFPGNNLQGPDSPDGIQYGLTSAGDNPATGNSPVTGDNALIRDSVTFLFSGATGLNLNEITGVSFQYGTALCDPNVPGVPIPPTALLLGSGLIGLGALGWRRRKQQS